MNRIDLNLRVWCVLILITLASVTFAELSGLRIASVVAIFAAAVIKGQIVAVQYMETPHALPHWSRLYRLWIVGIGGALCCGVIASSIHAA